MSFFNSGFFMFLVVAVIIYYIVPKRFQWIILLIASYVYYLSFNVKTVIYLIATTFITYIGAIMIEKIDDKGTSKLQAGKEKLTREEKKSIKAHIKHNKRIILAFILVCDFGILSYLKYFNFFLENIDSVLNIFQLNINMPRFNLMLPIGISFYTFQSTAYIIDVYQKKYASEKNPFKFALFVSFFPQILQGPIGRFDRLSSQFFEKYKFDLVNIEFAVQLILWGLCKKLILAERTAGYVNLVFANPDNYYGFHVIIALLMYSIQLYADFSGGMDIVVGSAQLFGIKIDQNFCRPYFSRSISEFWRRWHITLGTWMKDYIFYPFSLSKQMNKFGKFSKKVFGNSIGRALPICVADILIFFLVGLWHGAQWKYIFYGLYNGFILAFSSLMEPVYDKTKDKLHINVKSKLWIGFQIIRTFVLVNIGWYFDMASGLRSAIKMMGNTIFYLDFQQLKPSVIVSVVNRRFDLLMLVLGCCIWFIVSLLQEKNINIRESIARKPLVVRWLLYLTLVFAAPIVGYWGKVQGFIYAQF